MPRTAWPTPSTGSLPLNGEPFPRPGRGYSYQRMLIAKSLARLLLAISVAISLPVCLCNAAPSHNGHACCSPKQTCPCGHHNTSDPAGRVQCTCAAPEKAPPPAGELSIPEPLLTGLLAWPMLRSDAGPCAAAIHRQRWAVPPPPTPLLQQPGALTL